MIPWSIDQRSLPAGADPSALCPEIVGPYRRTSIDGNLVIDSNSVYVKYAAGAATIFMEFAVSSTPSIAHGILLTASQETGGVIEGSEPRWFGTGDFFAWTRGGHFFSAHAKGGAADLDAFMRAFPY